MVVKIINPFRPRRIFLLAFSISMAVAFLLPAANAPTDATNNAAGIWRTLTNWSLLPPPMSWQTNLPTPEQISKFDDQQANRAGALADGARDFYRRFPDDTNAFPAHLIELQGLQLAVRYGATNRLAMLDARERAIIADTNVPAAIHYELRLDMIGRELKVKAAAGADMNATLEKVGRELVREFPGGPAGYEILVEIAEKSDLSKMYKLGEFMANSGGPEVFINIGNGLLRRVDAVGKPLAIEFTAADGRAVNLTTLSNKVVLVDFWATWCPVCVTLMPEVKRLYNQFHTNGFEVVGINFDDDTNAAQRFIGEKGLAWPQYFGGRDNKFGREYSVNALPSAWLADRKGIVRDIHGTENLAAKIGKLMSE